jgi:hypothetical protein
MGVSGQHHAPAALCPGERTPGTHCTGGWVGPRAGLDTEVIGKLLCPCRGSNPDRPDIYIYEHIINTRIKKGSAINGDGKCQGYKGSYSLTIPATV